MTDRVYRVEPEDILRVACRLAEENLGNTPTHAEIADAIGCSRQLVQILFRMLERDGLIVWTSKNRYKIPNSEWTPPPDVEF